MVERTCNYCKWKYKWDIPVASTGKTFQVSCSNPRCASHTNAGGVFTTLTYDGDSLPTPIITRPE
jgi:YD repeat-containing protein